MSACLTAPSISDEMLRQIDAIFDPLRTTTAPGGLAGIALDGEVIYRRGFGLASVQHGVANRPETRFRIASTSKHFTCLAVLLLAEDRLLDIDAPAESYLPGLPAPLGAPTLRNFMAHTSGYRCTLEMGTVANGFAAQPPEWQLQALLRQGDVHFAPGNGQLYCNGTYHALSSIIERVSGIGFEDFLRQRIFEPLQMFDTDSVPDDSLMVPGLSSAHVPDGSGGWRRPPVDSELRGDGGMVSTLDDMLRWLAHLNGPKRVGSDATWQTMLALTRLRNGFQSTYGLGLKRHDYRGVEIVHHSGGLLGISAQMLTVPALGLDVMIHVNGAPFGATGLARQVVDLVLGGQLTRPAPLHPSARDFAHLVGQHFAGPRGLLLGFGAVEGHLALSLQFMHPSSVLYLRGDEVIAAFEDIGLGPLVWQISDLQQVDQGAAPDCLPVVIAGERIVMRRIVHAGEVPDEWVACWPGRYFCEDLRCDAEVANEQGKLVVRLRGDYSGWRSFDIQPLGPQHVGLESRSKEERYAVELDVQPDRTGVHGFWIDTYRARRLRFERTGD